MKYFCRLTVKTPESSFLIEESPSLLSANHAIVYTQMDAPTVDACLELYNSN